MALPHRLAIAAATAGVAALAGCASAPKQSAGAPPSAAQSSRYVLTAGDIVGTRAETLYDAVLKLRPEFIHGRGEHTRPETITVVGGPPGGTGAGGSSAGATEAVSPPVPALIVYKDGDRIGGVDEMRHILPSQVAEVRYMPGPEAMVKFGTQHAGGVILITSK